LVLKAAWFELQQFFLQLKKKLKINNFFFINAGSIMFTFNDQRPEYCEMAQMLHTSINSQRLFPSKLSGRMQKQYTQCEEQKQQNRVAANAVVGVALLFLTGPLAAAFAPGLFGAAAVSHGLAVLGGGSLAAGGFGMTGGTLLISTAGSIFGQALVGLGDCKPNPIGMHEDFYSFDSGKIAFSGTIQVTSKDILFSKGKLFDPNGKMLYSGKFVNNIPSTCQ
jgi:hypothetical protein